MAEDYESVKDQSAGYLAMIKQPEKSADESFIHIIEKKVLFWWERYGLDYLAVTEPTLAAFKQQELPELLRTTVKKRVGRKSKVHGERYSNNIRAYREIWQKDNQAIYNYPTLVFVINGTADFHVADYLIECPANHFLFFRDNVPRPTAGAHLVGHNISRRRCDILWFFAPPGFHSVISYICHSNGSKHWSEGYHIVQQRNAVQAFDIFVEEIQEKELDWRHTVSSSFQTFLYLFLRELKEGRFLNTIPSHEITPGESSIERAKTYIEAHLHQPLTSELVSGKVYMSRKSFTDHFKRESGQTFHEFLTEKRMERAQYLLSAGNWSINSIAERVGLKPTAFASQFKARFHMTPSEFQRRQQNLRKSDDIYAK